MNKHQEVKVIYNIPGELVEKLVMLINSLPYGQIAPLAGEFGQWLNTEQSKFAGLDKLAQGKAEAAKEK